MKTREQVKAISDKIRTLEKSEMTIEAIKSDIVAELKDNHITEDRASKAAQRCAEIIREEFGAIEHEVADFLGELSNNIGKSIPVGDEMAIEAEIERQLDEMAAKDPKPVSKDVIRKRRKRIKDRLTK